MATPIPDRKSDLLELVAIFLRLGATAFGGPAGHLALMEREFVATRGWLTHQEFLDINGATNLIPGPNSTEMAIHIGYRRGGVVGMVVSGICFIVPAAVIVALIASAYVRYGSLPEVSAAMYGVKAAMIAVIVQALIALAIKSIKSPALALLGGIVGVLSFLDVNELILLFGSGASLGVAAWYRHERRNLKPIIVFATIAAAFVLLPLVLQSQPTQSQPFSVNALGLFFLKVGSVLFGSGYVLIAFLRADLVARWHWLSANQLLDSIAVGQVTPGPVFTTATFIGFLLAGPMGALVATIAIFLPSFLFVGLSGPLLPRIRKSYSTAAFLDGVNVASVCLMASVVWQLVHSAIIDLPSAAIAVASLYLLLRTRVNSVWIILGSCAAGWIVKAL